MPNHPVESMAYLSRSFCLRNLARTTFFKLVHHWRLGDGYYWIIFLVIFLACSHLLVFIICPSHTFFFPYLFLQMNPVFLPLLLPLLLFRLWCSWLQASPFFLLLILLLLFMLRMFGFTTCLTTNWLLLTDTLSKRQMLMIYCYCYF